jgi:hypothetical protein
MLYLWVPPEMLTMLFETEGIAADFVTRQTSRMRRHMGRRCLPHVLLFLSLPGALLLPLGALLLSSTRLRRLL